ncbi:LOW QUALITY PROTEIN: hypothetical protein PanWU01x14_215370 [Parasponia andersonii]|uniref:Uncharacterized protein n=1 Tax=Parasponia andersonii TaxID=3476 RepID=A0A2P5BS58_PARAD|nr:LOW QUALITY PROTEIN: hypothetical protein PanWU01x14_215370 [Parasponia andersonii]
MSKLPSKILGFYKDDGLASIVTFNNLIELFHCGISEPHRLLITFSHTIILYIRNKIHANTCLLCVEFYSFSKLFIAIHVFVNCGHSNPF